MKKWGLIFLAGYCVFGGLLLYMAISQESPTYVCRVSVSEQSARLVFPVNDQEWEWNKPETQLNYAEYTWAINIDNADKTIEAGFFLFRHPDAHPGHGSLNDLLDEGQMSVWICIDEICRVDDEFNIEFSIEKGTVVGVVEDSSTMNLMFSEKPSNATCLVRLPNAEEVKSETAVIYE